MFTTDTTPTAADFLLTLPGPVQTMLVAEIAEMQAQGMSDEEIISSIRADLESFEG